MQPVRHNVFELLVGEDDGEMISCQACQEMTKKSDRYCSHCGERAVLPTLSELGQKLPIGVLKESKESEDAPIVRTLDKDFEVRKIGFKLEKQIRESWVQMTKRPETSPMHYLPTVLCHTVTRLAGQDFQSLSFDRRMYALTQMFMGDVFYMYAYSRLVSMGPNVPISGIQCPDCGGKIKDFATDLNTLEVSVRDDAEKLIKRIELQDGFRMRDKLCKVVHALPATFGVFADRRSGSSADLLSNMIKTCIVEIEGMHDGDMMTDIEIEQLYKTDLSILDQSLDYITGGPVWAVEIDCPAKDCQASFVDFIDWRYENFFRVSSVSSRWKGLSKT